MVLAPFFPPIVQFRPYYVRFETSNFHGVGPFATPCHLIVLVIVSTVSTMEEATMALLRSLLPQIKVMQYCTI
jgi:hypothetical protein